MTPRFDDPTTWPRKHAPGLKQPKPGHFYWTAPKKYVKAGWSPERVRLAAETPEERASACRGYTRDLLDWWASQAPSDAEFGTWAYVIRRYRTDEFSDYAGVKANTKRGYDFCCDKWLEIIGHMPVEALTFETIKKIERAMRDNNRTDSYVHRLFTQLRAIVKHGALIRETKAMCRPVKETLGDMTFRTAPARSIAPTREQVEAIVAAADADGQEVWATGILVQFEFILRAVDVRGQWLSEGVSQTDTLGGIVRNGRRWQDGLTWEMFDRDLTRFEKVISKTARTMPEPYVFDLTSVPYLRARIARNRPENAVGPVFVSQTGLPFDQTTWARLWAKYRKRAGVPEEVKAMDARAGGATEARDAGAGEFDLRDAAQHKQLNTTGRYIRGRSDASAKVVKLRQEKRK